MHCPPILVLLTVCLLALTLGCGDESERPGTPSSTTQSEAQCLADCGAGCPAPELQPCASDGNTYCNACTIACKGLTVVDAAMCTGSEPPDTPTADMASDASEADMSSNVTDGDMPADATETEEECLAGCGAGCPAPEFQPCASDGNTYCNACTIECKGLTQVDAAMCTESEEACLARCDIGCPGPGFQPCASDGNTYCNVCTIECKGLTVVDKAECE